VQVRCDRGQPDCGWCTRNGQLCEYKERKKPGLRAGYGRELERRLGIKYGTSLSSPMAAEHKLDRHEARLHNHEKRLEIQEIKGCNKDRTIGSRLPGYLPGAQACSTRPIQLPRSIMSHAETCSTSAPKGQESSRDHGIRFPRNSPSFGAGKTQSQYTVEVTQKHIAVMDKMNMLTLQVVEPSQLE